MEPCANFDHSRDLPAPFASTPGEVTAMCRHCGPVRVRVRQVRLVVSNITERSTFSWRCPICAAFHERIATSREQDILARAAAVPAPLDIPAEALEVHVGAPLNEDDLIDFMMEIEHLVATDAAVAPDRPTERSAHYPIDLVRDPVGPTVRPVLAVRPRSRDW